MSTSCIIVAGGSSRRMGNDKRRLRLWSDCGPMLLEHMVTRAARISDDVVVALNDPAAWSGLPARLVCDEIAHGGPLAGLAAGLAVCRYEYALAMACDLPLVQDALIDALLAYPRPYDALAPLRPNDGARAPRNALAVEPLLAVYRRTCLPAIRACLQRGARALVDPLGMIDTRYLAPDVWRQYDPHGLSFINLNRPEDVARVKTIIADGGR
ncbi:molybdenum cofactor guanylyltransferase [Roseiflexus castenholzii]|uniref:Probable molybdenum cofactor guanylyltransferase n=1 Tax=Roseiflexus castenholzii (strain DSM 13941 / HLO8) TaxID=383372 RepID=A7NG06_ROSCS|nr:molybdenum cofactor guanylyltransferase [Roseiflexus castenholzii]ABU56393.1 molybdopterin-guanine dinucleotide biosynthesis protein A-like protein [Roseiflexus castenholzii DSM 13941]